MIHLRLADSGTRRLAFYLAMEEWAARTLPAGEYFFSWRVQPTVICGRNQDIEAEVDLEYCRRENIDVVRRKSGGGCVFANMENLMFSYITQGDAVEETFAHYTSMIADMLQSLGLPAIATGRNDILIRGRKVSGNAFYHLPGRAIAHGTMLYGLDLERLAKAITPSKAKLLSKGVQSVPMRVTCLRDEGLGMDISRFGHYAVEHLTDSVLELSADDIAAITAIEQTYYDPAYFHGRQPTKKSSGIQVHRYLAGTGDFTAVIILDNSGKSIDSITLSGDFFALTDVNHALNSALKGVVYSKEAISEALRRIDATSLVAGLDAGALADILTSGS